SSFTQVKDNALLGNYFGGKGWPIYDIPADPLGNIKIPAGQNVFAQSPEANVPSSYDSNKFMLTSAGGGPIKINLGGVGTNSTGKILQISPLADVNLVKQLASGFTVVGNPPNGKANPIKPGTKIDKVLHVSTGPTDSTLIQLDTDLQ